MVYNKSGAGSGLERVHGFAFVARAFRGGNMKEFSYTIRREAVLHARPVAALVQRLKPLEERVTLTCGARSADAKKIFAVMAMEIQQGEKVTLSVDGPNEGELCEELLAFFEQHF